MKLLKIRLIVLDDRLKLVVQLIVAVQKQTYRAFAQVYAVRDRRDGVVDDYLPPNGISHIPLPVALEHIVKPFIRERLGFKEAVNFHNGVAQVDVAALAGKSVKQLAKICPALIVKSLDSDIHSRCLHQLQLGGISYAIVGGHTQRVKIFLYQIAAEAVYRADRSGVQQLALVDQLSVERVVLQQL